MEVIEGGQLERAAHAIESGGLVVVPTSRWYMVCADASNDSACAQIFTAKKRQQTKSLAYVVPDVGVAADRFAMSDQSQRLADAFWPGDLALILPWRDHRIGELHKAVGSPNALVVQEEGILGELARLASAPVAATTVNLAGTGTDHTHGPAITLDEVETFAAAEGLDLALAIDGGVCPRAHHLTIVDCTAEVARLARVGLVHQRAIAAILDG